MSIDEEGNRSFGRDRHFGDYGAEMGGAELPPNVEKVYGFRSTKHIAHNLSGNLVFVLPK